MIYHLMNTSDNNFECFSNDIKFIIIFNNINYSANEYKFNINIATPPGTRLNFKSKTLMSPFEIGNMQI